MFCIISRRFHFALYSPSLLYVLFFSSMCFSGFPNVNYTYRGKPCFSQFYTIFFFLNKSVCVSDLSHMFAQSITSTHSFVKKYKCLKKKDSSNRQKMNCCSFHQDLQQKLSWFFSSHRKALFIEVSFSIQEKEGRFF